MNNQNTEHILEKLFEYYNVVNAAELSEKINTSQKTISNWKVRNSIGAVKKKCRELGIYNEIFRVVNAQEIPKNSSDVQLENKSDLSKYFTALESVAIATNKEDELLTDIRELIKKYIQ